MNSIGRSFVIFFKGKSLLWLPICFWIQVGQNILTQTLTLQVYPFLLRHQVQGTQWTILPPCLRWILLCKCEITTLVSVFLHKSQRVNHFLTRDRYSSSWGISKIFCLPWQYRSSLEGNIYSFESIPWSEGASWTGTQTKGHRSHLPCIYSPWKIASHKLRKILVGIKVHHCFYFP